MTAPERDASVGDVVADLDEGWCRLRDETLVRIRAARASDRPAILAFVGHLAAEALPLRFFSALQPGALAAEHPGEPSAADRFSVVLEAFDTTPPQIVGHAEYVRYPAPPTRAEVAFLVSDRFQGRGAGQPLLHQLARRARAAGIHTFEAIVLSENRAMRNVFVEAGFPYSIVLDGTETLIELDIRNEPDTAPALLVPP